VRRGVLSVVTSDSDAEMFLQIAGKLDPSLTRIRGHLLTVLDGLAQDMTRADLTWGAAAHVIAAAGWAA
jgi:hypothetical protein